MRKRGWVLFVAVILVLLVFEAIWAIFIGG